MDKIKFSLLFILLVNLFLINVKSEEEHVLIPLNHSSQRPEIYFSKIYIDGMSANSNGFKILLRPYQRRIAEGLYNPSIVDVKFGIVHDNEIIFTDTIEQASFFEPVELSGHWKIILTEGINYTAFAQVFLYDNEKQPTYISTSFSSFMSETDAEITNVHGDGIGSSVTIKSKSMVPLDGKVLFLLKQNDTILEEKEIDSPMITSTDEDKTIEVLWDKNLGSGRYVVETKLMTKKEKIIDRYDKVFEIKETTTNVSAASAPTEVVRKTPGFSGIQLIILILIINILRRLR